MQMKNGAVIGWHGLAYDGVEVTDLRRLFRSDLRTVGRMKCWHFIILQQHWYLQLFTCHRYNHNNLCVRLSSNDIHTSRLSYRWVERMVVVSGQLGVLTFASMKQLDVFDEMPGRGNIIMYFWPKHYILLNPSRLLAQRCHNWTWRNIKMGHK